MYESDDVVGSMVIGETPTGVEAAVWAPLGVRNQPATVDPGALPVGTTTDRRVIADLHAHVDSLIAGREPLTSNEALCRVPDGAGEPVFTRYFTVGEDQEEDVDDSEGMAVALMLVVAKCPRKQYGVGRRVITYMRSRLRQDPAPLAVQQHRRGRRHPARQGDRAGHEGRGACGRPAVRSPRR